VGADAYPSALRARQFAFKHDRGNLKKRLGVDYVFEDATQLYVLNDAGPYGRVSLSPPMLRALSVLSRQYNNAVGDLAGVRDLVQQVIGWLPPEIRLQIESASEELTLDFEQDVDPVSFQRAVGFQTRWISIANLSTISRRHADRKPVFHELVSYQIRFQDGHWYLRGYSLN
jgi:hypothetical protein